MKANKINNGRFFITVGILLLMAAVSLSIFNLYQSRKAKETAETVVGELLKDIEKQKEENGDEKDSGTIGAEYEEYPDMEMPIITVNGEAYIGYIEIPAINLVLPVMGGEWNEDKMKTAPCLYEGSAYRNDMVIAGHNYVDHFGRLNALSSGSEVYFTDGAGNRFEYSVGWTETVNGTDIEGMVEEGGWDMTLFTCNYSGEKRIAVRCILAN